MDLLVKFPLSIRHQYLRKLLLLGSKIFLQSFLSSSLFLCSLCFRFVIRVILVTRRVSVALDLFRLLFLSLLSSLTLVLRLLLDLYDFFFIFRLYNFFTLEMLDFLITHWHVAFSLIINKWRQVGRWRYSRLVLRSWHHE